MKQDNDLTGNKERFEMQRATFSAQLGDAVINGSYVGSEVGWRWLVKGIVIIIITKPVLEILMAMR